MAARWLTGQSRSPLAQGGIDVRTVNDVDDPPGGLSAEGKSADAISLDQRGLGRRERDPPRCLGDHGYLVPAGFVQEHLGCGPGGQQQAAVIPPVFVADENRWPGR
jgi:hypothetical protein